MEGVLRTAVGYCGGKTQNPTYPDVCTGTTGHAETVEVEYDPGIISYDQLLKLFWEIHDPTSGRRQGWNIGDQYRSAVFCSDNESLLIANASKEIEQVNRRKPITTQILSLDRFWRAEEYHQQYYAKKGVGSCHI